MQNIKSLSILLGFITPKDGHIDLKYIYIYIYIYIIFLRDFNKTNICLWQS